MENSPSLIDDDLLRAAESDASFRTHGSPIGDLDFWLRQHSQGLTKQLVKAVQNRVKQNVEAQETINVLPPTPPTNCTDDHIDITPDYYHGGDLASWTLTNGKPKDPLRVVMSQEKTRIEEEQREQILKALEEFQLLLVSLMSDPDAHRSFTIRGPGNYRLPTENNRYKQVNQTDWTLNYDQPLQPVARAESLEKLLKQDLRTALCDILFAAK